jgi:hypothetical protein
MNSNHLLIKPMKISEITLRLSRHSKDNSKMIQIIKLLNNGNKSLTRLEMQLKVSETPFKLLQITFSQSW